MDVPWLRFEVAEQGYAVPLGAVVEVMAAPSPHLIPRVALDVGGMVNVRGEPVPAVDGGALLTGRPARRHRHMLVLERGSLRLGVLVGGVHRIEGELVPERAAEHYTFAIQKFFGLEEGELPHFDVIQQGMGPEGHTASLFPDEPLIDDREGIAAAVCTPKPPPWRVTLLPGVLLAAHHTVFLVSGEDKAPAVKSVLQDDYNPKLLPAQVVSHHGRSVTWFLDDAASRLLREPG